jgi:isoleucyl-tRNA synthetase
MFKPVSSKVNFPELEDSTLKWWRANGIFERSVKARQDKPRFVFYEGPPFANGNPGIHHVLARVFKDVIVRYRTMKGYYVPRIAGWDTHGLPVELEIEKQLGFSGKKQIEEYGVGEFNRRCRESVFTYLKEWNTLTERIAYWVDLDKAYMTMSNDYVESVWWAVKQLWDHGFIYQGYRVTPHCPRCGTSLSSHEVAQGYQDDVEDPSIFVKFKIVLSSLKRAGGQQDLAALVAESHKPAYLLAWTTTPWTLPANTALAVGPDAEYVAVQNTNEYVVVASARLGPAGLGDASVAARLSGSDLVGVKYEPLFNPADFGVSVTRMTQPATERKRRTNGYPVIAEDFVSMEDGTGIVHVAPAYGEIDYEAGRKHHLDFVHTVDLQGRVIGSYPFAGKFVKAADPLIVEDLRERGLLHRSETIRHTYPFCWRCATPLVYYAKQSWYIKTTAVKERMLDANREINWHPEHVKFGRFGDWLANNVDWAFSRERYWGTPLPIWQCGACGAMECAGSVAELKAKPRFSGLKEPLDLHRPFLDDVRFACSSCGGEMRRTPEVMDCWFDSGSMPFAQLHYPFDNKQLFDGEMKQADFICEAVDQTRGWFYSLHAISTMLFDRNSFKNVICLGLILDAKGEKMSKTRGNVVSPWQVISKYGADPLRWYLFTASPPGNARRFDEKQVLEVTRRFLLTLWNVYSFFVTYANIDDFRPGASGAETARLSELDRWILSELNQLVKEVDSGLEDYDPTEAGRRIEAFVDRLSNWYVRRSRRRFWKSGSDSDKLAAYNTLYDCLLTVSKLLAPFIPFVAEELYRNLVAGGVGGPPESVHLADFPGCDEAKIDSELSADIRLAMDLSSLGRAARSQTGIKVRQPLPVVHFGFGSVGASLDASLQRIKPQLLDELNIKDVKWDTKDNISPLQQEGCVISGEDVYCAMNPTIPDYLKGEGMAREVVHRIQTMRRSAGFEIADRIVTHYDGDAAFKETVTRPELADYIRQETLSDRLEEGIPGEGTYNEDFRLDGHEVKLGVRRV